MDGHHGLVVRALGTLIAVVTRLLAWHRRCHKTSSAAEELWHAAVYKDGFGSSLYKGT